MDKKTARHARGLWLHYGVFWSGAIAVGLLAVLYPWLIDFGYSLFRAGFDRHPWLALIVTPAVGALYVALTRRFFRGAEGSGIPGGIFAPTLSIGAGIDNVMHVVFVHTSLPVLIALAMAGYLAAVTQSPITAFVIVIEMIKAAESRS